MKMIDEKKMGKTFQILQPLLVFRQNHHPTGDIVRRRRLDGCALGLGKG